MSDSTFMGVPREKNPWFPTIDYEKCNYCMECDKFCPHRVFERRETEERKLVVANPNNCVVFCRAAQDLRSRRDLVPQKAGNRGHD